MEEINIFRSDGPLFDQRIEIDHPLPKRLSKNQHWEGFDFAGLNQGQCFKKFVQGPETAGKTTKALARIRKCILRMAK